LRNLGYLDDAAPALRPMSAAGRVMNMLIEAVGWSVKKLPRRVVRVLRVPKVQSGFHDSSGLRAVGKSRLDATPIHGRLGGLQ